MRATSRSERHRARATVLAGLLVLSALAAVGTVPAATAAPGDTTGPSPLVNYTFEGGCPIADTSGNGNDGTCFGGIDTSGSESFTFDGTDDYIDGPEIGPTDAFAWVVEFQTSADQGQYGSALVARWDGNEGNEGDGTFGGSNKLQLGGSENHGSGILQFQIVGTDGNTYKIEGTENLADGQPHRVVGAYDGSQMRLYVDGQLIGTNESYSGSIVDDDDKPIRIGARGDAQAVFYAGEMDQVTIYDGVPDQYLPSEPEPAPEAGPISVENASTTVGSTATANVTLETAPAGLAGYTLTVGIENGTVGDVTDVTIPDTYELSGPTAIGPDGDTVHLQATDLDNETVAGDTDVRLATLTLEGSVAGTSNVSVESIHPSTAVDGGGELNAPVEAGTFTVEETEQQPSPTDFDGDGVPNSQDSDDDNDGKPDTNDAFAIDPDDGTTTSLPVELDFQPDSQPNTILGVGFTGLMKNGTDYQELYDPGQVTVDGDLTIQDIPVSTPAQVNNQVYGFQLGIDPPNEPFAVNSTVSGLPADPEDYQNLGIQLGQGDQGNFTKVVIGNGPPEVEFGKESDDEFLTPPDGSGSASYRVTDTALAGPDTQTNLSMVVDPATNTVTAYYKVEGESWTQVVGADGNPATWSVEDWLDTADGTGLAVGLISTSVTPDGPAPFDGTWEHLTVETLGDSGVDNTSPTADAGTDQTVDEGIQVSLDASGSSDPDAGDTLNYSWMQTGGTSVSLTDANTATPNFTAPDVESDETLTFQVTVDDGDASATDTVNVTVQDTAPTADFDGDGIPNAQDSDDDNDGQDDTVDHFAVDPDDGTTTDLPVDLEFEPGSHPNTILGVGFTGLMNNGTDYQELYDPGEITVDGTITFEVDGTDAHNGIYGGDGQRNGFQVGFDAPDEPFSVNTTVSGMPANPVDFQTAGIQLGNGDQSNYVKLVVAANGGDGGVEFGMEDGGSWSTDTADASGVLGPDTQVHLSIVVDPATDTAEGYYRIEDGDWQSTGITYQIPQSWLDTADGTGLAAGLIGTSVTSNGAAPFTATWENLTVGTLDVTTTNTPPIADAGSDQTVDEGIQVSLDASGSSDPDAGDTLNYSWMQTGGTSVSLTDANTATPNFTAPDVDGDETLTFQVTVDDGDASATDTVNVTVQDTDDAALTVAEGVASQEAPNDQINLAEIQTAIDWWASDTQVPGTDGETIDLAEIQSLIDTWAADATVGGSSNGGGG
jgi:flagellar basal body rod protein FlgB